MHAAADVALMFDTDGTLVDARRAVVDAVAEGLAETYRHFYLPVPRPDPERIALAMGLPSSAFFRVAFDPATVPQEQRDAFSCEFEVRSVRAEVAALDRGDTDLYPGVEETLETLAERGHRLFLFSNATSPYFEAVVRAHRLDRFFTRMLSLEAAVRWRLARDKEGMIRHLSHGFGSAVVIGDRVHDVQAGHAAGARTVGCRYGFGEDGELDTADWIIETTPELIELPFTARTARPGTGTG
ncbi:MAG: HAD family hydrolase [Candidatus Krumholzibacteriia bacterium]